MYPWIGTGGVTTLDSDDRVAIATMYPKPAANPGATLEGRVTGDGGGIFAAQVVALSDSGEPVATALTDRDGNFILQGIPSGNYRVYAEPLDGPVNVANLSGTWRTAKVTSFPTQFADNGTSIRVESGKIYGNLNVNGATLDGLYYCPAGPGEHPDRKPAPGMLLRAAGDLALDLARSWVVGDSARDIVAGHAAGCRGGVLVRSGHDPALALALLGGADLIAADLAEAARLILSHS